jgi:hypothetical protein
MLTDLLLADSEQLAGLIRRSELLPQLLLRREEEEIASLVGLPQDWLDDHRQQWLSGRELSEALAAKGWTETDLDLHLSRPEALRRFARQRFGPGLEEAFLASRGGHDQIVYSLLRVGDAALAQELWIRLEEGETTFAEAASMFSEGPEASRKGVIGPQTIAQLQPPELADLIRSLRPGQLHPPRRMGEWSVLLRLEQLVPARFDAEMQERLLQQQLQAFLEERVQQRMAGVTPDPLHYAADPEPES